MPDPIRIRAFTFGNHIFFNTGQYQPQTPEGLELLAHELTHTIQQQAVIQRAVNDAPVIGERTAPQASRLGMSDALNYFADAANAIPGYRMLTIVIGTNPITGRSVERSAANILRAFVEFLPGGALITEALDRYGVFDRVGGWIEGQLATLGLSGAGLKVLLDQFLAGLSWTDIFNLGSVWDRAKSRFTSVVDRLLGFVRGLAGAVLGYIRDAILKPLAELASQTPAWDLLCAVLGRNPITGEAVPRTADTLIGGFMKLIGQEEIWENIKKGNAIARAWAWFQTALGGLMALVTLIPERFMATLRSLEVSDLVLPFRALIKVGTAFASFLGNFIAWAGGTIWNLLEIIFSVVAPEVIVYLKRAQSAFRTIIQNPMRSVGTLVSAVLTGFQLFASRFLTHLQAGIIGWLTGALGSTGVYIPQGLSIPEILKFVLSLLGLTWANILALLVRESSENVVVAMEQGFAIVRTLMIESPAAAWQQIVEGLGNLRDMVIGQVMEFVKGQIVNIAVTRLMLLLNPADAFVQAILAIWNTIQFMRERIRQIAQVAASVIDAIAEIAAGNIAPAANRVELTMAGLLPVVISFLARQVGLGNVGEAVTAFLERVRAPIRQGLTRVVRWIVAQARRLGRFVAQAGVPRDPNERLRLASQASLSIATRLPRTGLTAPLIARAHDAIKIRYGLRELTPYRQNNAWFVRAVVNPPLVWRLPLPDETAGTGGIRQVSTQTGPDGVVTAGVQGEIRTGIGRQDMENALPRSGALPGLAANYLKGYARAHLWGPGFGDETAIGLMYASTHVNNFMQSLGRVRGIEGRLRELAAISRSLGGSTNVTVTGESYPDPPPGVPGRLDVPVLKVVVYQVTIRAPDGRTDSGRGSIHVDPPRPNGAGGRGTFDVGTL